MDGRAHRPDLFTTVRTEGGLLPVDVLQRVVNADASLPGLQPASYHLAAGERLNEAINRSWNRLLPAWASFEEARRQLSDNDAGTTITRERWLLPLFQELGYGRLQTSRGLEIEGKAYPVSHRWVHVPIHLVGCRIELDRRTAGVAGAARMSPHGLVQEALNRADEDLWGFVSNGLRLRLLRDNASLTRPSFVEFDLEAMMQGEVYADFVLLWLLCHESRLEGDDGRPETCWLERWSQQAQRDGTRALDELRNGVTAAIEALGTGFLRRPSNGALRDKLRAGALDQQDYYRQLLRTVYRLLFLFVAEDRDLLLRPDAPKEARERYTRYYSTERLRRLARSWRGTAHVDLWRAVTLVFTQLGSDDGCPALGLPALGSFLWSAQATPDLDGCDIANVDLLDAIRRLAFIDDRSGMRSIDYRNLGPEELGSVYESLLELHPTLNLDAHTFTLLTAGGNERKTTGSYYTPTSLIVELLNSALDPVLDEAITHAADPEQAILSLKVVDPAAGSGHFLVAAAHRMARRLATVRTGDGEPSPEATRAALRDVIGRCIYGVDINPMAVELCKVSLWLEAMEPGKPLTFLDHHIQCGNSLLGATPELIAQGIPDAAFDPIEGDDKKVAAEWKKRNKEQRKGQLSFDDRLAPAWERLGELAVALQGLEEEDDDTLAGVRRKQEWWEELVRGGAYEYGKLLADAWCAAFVFKKTRDFAYPITQNVLNDIRHNPHGVAPWMRDEIRRLAEQYHFFHWHLAFPDVFRVPGPDALPENAQAGWIGGFDVVLGNPPWERIKLQEKEWFAERRPDIAKAANAATRRRLINSLADEDPAVYAAFLADRRQAEGESHVVRNSGRYPLCGRGDINTYAIFAETNRLIVGSRGRVGCIVPSGIATDDTTKHFFRDLMEHGDLVSLYDFENREGIFPGVHRSYKFCLLTLSGPDHDRATDAEFAFFLHGIEDLRDPERRFTLTAADLALLNPNTRTCPIFRTRRDAEITKAIYQRVPILIKEGSPGKNPWGITFLRMFDMANDSHLFRTREQLEAAGWRLEGNVFVRGSDRYLPLYEAKMIHQFDHRWTLYDGTEARAVTTLEKKDPRFVVLPRYWVPDRITESRIPGNWEQAWLPGFRDICRNTDERTVIAAAIPKAGVGHTMPLLFSPHDWFALACLQANLSCFVFDYVARQKVGGTHLTYGFLKQLPTLTPESVSGDAPWQPERLDHWISQRVLELTYTSWDMEPFSQFEKFSGPPFRWDEERRFLLRCELDAAYFHLYGIARDDVDYIMDTFPIVRRKDIAAHGSYRTKEVILEIYDAMAEAMRTGEPYQTRLDPPPADRRAAHSAVPGAVS